MQAGSSPPGAAEAIGVALSKMSTVDVADSCSDVVRTQE